MLSRLPPMEDGVKASTFARIPSQSKNNPPTPDRTGAQCHAAQAFAANRARRAGLRTFGCRPLRTKSCYPEPMEPGCRGIRVAGFALRVLSRAAVTLMPWPKVIPVAGCRGARKPPSAHCHFASPEAFYSGSGSECRPVARRAWNYCCSIILGSRRA
jgi:hypothetical protein